MDARAIEKVLLTTPMADGWRIGLIDEDGAFIARSSESDQWVGKPAPQDLVEASRRSLSGMVYDMSADGLLTLNVFNRVPGADWTILVSIPQKVLYAPVMRSVGLLLGLILLATALAALLAFVFQRRINSAIARLLAIASDPLRNDAEAMATHTFAEFETVVHILRTHAGSQQRLIEDVSASAQRHRATLSALSEGVVTHGPDGTVMSCNPAAERILGLTFDQLRGFLKVEPGAQYIHEDGTPFPFEKHPSSVVLRNGVAQPNVIMGIVKSDGARTWILVNAMPIRNPEELLPEFVVVSFSDITERMQAEAVLTLERGKLAAAFENSSVGFILSDAQGGSVSMNATALALYGYPGKEDVPRSFEHNVNEWELHYGNGRLLPFAAWPSVRAIRGDFLRNVELYGHNTRNGKSWVCNLTTTPVRDRAGKVIFILQTMFDITETKRLEQTLLVRHAELEKATAFAEEASLAKSNFLNSMSHELRTPLNAILGFAQLMESSSASPPSPSQKRSIEQILTAGWHLLDLVNEILDLAQIESGRVAVTRQVVSLESVMTICHAMVEPLAHKRGIAMDFPQFDAPCYIDGDPIRIKQVLINLIYNAIKYNRPAGTVAVEWTLVPPNAIRISVRDTGLGLAADKLAQLFQPFNRLGQEASAVQGTGIGLVVSKRLVELMGGTIGAESTVGVGSVFWIEMGQTSAPPHAVVHARPAAMARPQQPDGMAQKTVLYVEDNPANLELVEELLKRRPELRLLSAADGSLGVEYARSYIPEVILMDLHLPGISGMDAMRILRADPSTANIPVVALSAHAHPGDIEKALAAGFFYYLTKPIVFKEFMYALDVALEFSRSISIHALAKD
jgi:PAS domain S-box-containing protein